MGQETSLDGASVGALWCINIQGPDDILPMPSRATALEEANKLNVYFGELASRPDATIYDPIMRAVVIEYPYTAESHAAGVARAALSSTKEQT
jgi:hypothetical protein